MQKIEAKLLASKFRGTLLGVLVGDTCGLPFELEDQVRPAEVKQNLDRLEGEYFKSPYKQYSDDTAMTKALAATLVQGYSQKEVAKSFTKEFFAEPWRGYGKNVFSVFQKLKSSKFANLTGPAQEQFGGRGSFGNGGAMRVAPVALYCWNNLEELTKMTTECTEVTHTVRIYPISSKTF